jgi:hypothetical protein
METKETVNSLEESADYVIRVPLDKHAKKMATFYLKEMREDIYIAAQSMIDQKKSLDAVRMIIKNLSMPGSDSVEVLKDNFVAVNAAAKYILEILTPVAGEIKKN